MSRPGHVGEHDDAIVIGGGRNGLTCAAYLSSAGLGSPSNLVNKGYDPKTGYSENAFLRGWVLNGFFGAIRAIQHAHENLIVDSVTAAQHAVVTYIDLNGRAQLKGGPASDFQSMADLSSEDVAAPIASTLARIVARV